MREYLHRQRFNRRALLRRLSAGVGSAWVVPGVVFGSAARPAPSERITLGCIGIGMMGQGHHRRFLQTPETQVLAVCDVDTWRRENARQLTDQAYGAERRSGRYRGCAAYNDLLELLARTDIDAVVIATGDRWHAVASTLAARAGKDIYCEKPMTLTIEEAQTVVKTVRRYGRVFQTGLQQRSTREFRLACQLVRDGVLGKIERVYIHFPGTSSDVDLPAEPIPKGLDWNRWLGQAPWRPYNHRFHAYGKPPRVVPWDFCRDFGGGNLTSNAVHAFDVVQWALGMDASGPTEIIPPQTGQYADLTYVYPGNIELQVVDRRLRSGRNVIPAGWDESTGIENFGAVYVGQHGWIHVGRRGYLKSFPNNIVEPYIANPASGVSVDDHHQDWLNAIRTRRRPAADVAIGCHSTTVAHLGCIAYWTGRKLRWNPARYEFVDDDEANRMRRRVKRAPWRI